MVDLNAPPPYWQPVKDLPTSVRADALEFPYIATANDPQDLWVTVQMEHCDRSWYAVLSWVDEVG